MQRYKNHYFEDSITLVNDIHELTDLCDELYSTQKLKEAHHCYNEAIVSENSTSSQVYT